MADERIMVTRSSMPSFEEYIEKIKPIWETHWMTNMGALHDQFSEQLKEYLCIENVELFTNGHMALELSLQALNLHGEVITTPFTFVSTTHAIVRNNLTPVFCDIDPHTFTIDVNKIESLITDRTCAIMPVHVYGNVCDVEAIEQIAYKYGLKVIYDSAHTFGEKYKGKSLGQYGDISCYSFHATKVFNSIEGGAACYKDKEIGRTLYELKNFGIRGPEELVSVGANAKMNEFCAAMGICNLRHVNEEIKKRKDIVTRYRERLCGVKGIQINFDQENVTHNYAYFPIVIDEKQFGATRNEVYLRLAQNNIYARKYFYPLTSTCVAFRKQYSEFDTPIALHTSQRVLTLPLYADLDVISVDKICNIIISCSKE